MDGTISTSEAAGPARQVASIPFRSPSVGPPEKVPPVSEGDRSRSSGQDEADLPGKVNRNPEPQDRKVEMGGPAETQAFPLPGDSSAPAPHEVLAEALAAAKARWVEVNQEAIEANARRAYSAADAGFSSKALDPTVPSGKDSSDVEMSNGLQRQFAIRYENLATSLSNPHPTQPVIDLFV